MNSLLPVTSQRFSRHPFQARERFLVLSTCQACAEARIASTYDGSLREWEQSHTCKAPTASKRFIESCPAPLRDSDVVTRNFLFDLENGHHSTPVSPVRDTV